MKLTRALPWCCLLAVTLLARPGGVAATESAGCAKILTSGTYRMVDQNVTRTYDFFAPQPPP